ncbi:MAG: right-handed parallel beta-helix repeat-containing protein [Chitinispirillia bacterium]|jgi:nitrous oxidase accessory protein NosD
MIKNLQQTFLKSKYFVFLMVLFPVILHASTTIPVPATGTESISAALVKARAGDTVIVENGTYKEKIFVKAGVILKARNLHKAIIDGMGKGTVVSLGSNSQIIGFVIQNGTIGVFTKNAGINISKCQIVRNWLTGIITVRHLPQIEDNIIAFNRASGIQGWNVRSTVASINHNTIAFNANHGIAMGGTSNIIVENNVIAYNERFALKLSTGSEKSKITKNNFYSNLKQLQKLPSGNYDFNPAFLSPRTAMDFKSDPRQCCQIKSSDNENLGARLE